MRRWRPHCEVGSAWVGCPSCRMNRQPVRAGTSHAAPRTCGWPQNDVRVWEELSDERMTILRNGRRQAPLSSR